MRQRAKTLELSVNRRGLPALTAGRCTPGSKQLGTRDGSAHDWGFTLITIVIDAVLKKQLGTRVGSSYVWSFTLFPAVTARRCTPGSKQLGTRVDSNYAWFVTYFCTPVANNWGLGLVLVMSGASLYILPSQLDAVLQVANSWGLGFVLVIPGSPL